MLGDIEGLMFFIPVFFYVAFFGVAYLYTCKKFP